MIYQRTEYEADNGMKIVGKRAVDMAAELFYARVLVVVTIQGQQVPVEVEVLLPDKTVTEAANNANAFLNGKAGKEALMAAVKKRLAENTPSEPKVQAAPASALVGLGQ